jgi:hypothetical protein
MMRLKKTGEIVKAVEDSGIAAIKTLLSAFDNLLPKEPNNKDGWLARPIIAAAVFNSLGLLLLSTITINDKYRKFCYILAFILLLATFILNIGIFFITFSLFSLVFNVIGDIPGIGINKTGLMG